MVGAAIACGLARSGMRILILDQQTPSPFNTGDAPHIRVSALSVASEQFLASLGAWEPIRAMRLCPYQRMKVWEKDVKPLPFIGRLPGLPSNLHETMFDSLDIGASHLGHIVENDVTQLGLHAAMAHHPNIECRTGVQITGLSNHANQPFASVLLGNGESVNAQLVIGADGALSKIRQWANIGLHSNQYEQHALVITVAYEGRQEDITWQAFTPTGPLAFLPLMDVGHEHFGSLVWYAPPEKLRQLQNLDDTALMQAIASSFPADLPPLTRIVEKGSFPLIKRHASHYFAHKVVLAGDAAHTINPLAGQGVNLGFQDAQALIECLLDAHGQGLLLADPAVLGKYERIRRPQNQLMMNIMDAFYHLFSNNHLPLKLLRNAGLAGANHLPFGKKKVMRYAMGLEQAIPSINPFART